MATFEVKNRRLFFFSREISLIKNSQFAIKKFKKIFCIPGVYERQQAHECMSKDAEEWKKSLTIDKAY